MTDKNTVFQVLCSLMKKPQLLGEVDKYKLTIDDFDSAFEKYIFSAIYNLYKDGAEKINVVDIDNYLTPHTSAKEIFNKYNGIEVLNDRLDMTQEDNFPFYYKRLKKFNCLRDFKKMGIDTSNLYVDDLTDDKAEAINDKFERMEVSDLFAAIKAKINKVETTYITEGETAAVSASKGIKGLINHLKSSPEVGAKLQGDIFNTVSRGARKGKFYIRTASSGCGKAIPNSTIIPTLNGDKKVGDIKVGDYLFDAFGNPTKVLGVYPQGKKRVKYVRFEDGREARCCDEHLWSFCTSEQDISHKENRKFYTKELKEIQNMDLRRSCGKYKVLVPMQYAANYSEKEFEIPPYILGLALGSDSFRQNLISKIPKVNSELTNIKSDKKFIPEKYLMGSIAQRLELLNGLLDADGIVDVKGRIVYITQSRQLKKDIIRLCQSLGFKVFIKVYEQINKDTDYIIEIVCRPEDKIKLFKLPKKRQLMQRRLKASERKEENNFNPIIEIGDCGYEEEMTCFYVDNDEHLFLMNDFIVTHNTRLSVGDACYLAYPIRFNPNKWEWEWNGSSEKTLFVATEQEISEVQTLVLAYLTSFNEEKILYSDYSDEELKIVQQALQVMEKFDNLFIVRIANPSIETIKAVIRSNWLTYEVENVFYDYIFSSPNLLNEFRDLKIREDVALGLMSTALKDLAVELGVFIMSSTQTNSKAKEEKNELSIRGARSIIDKCDLACIVSRVTDEELNLLQDVVKDSGMIPNQVIDVYKNRRGKHTNVRIWSDCDLGNCRKQDLFITTPNLKRVDDFSIVKFQFQFDGDMVTQINDLLKEVNEDKLNVQKNLKAVEEKIASLNEDEDEDIPPWEERPPKKEEGLFGDLID